MNSNSHNAVEHFHDILSRSKANFDRVNYLTFNIIIKLTAGTPTVKEKKKNKLKGVFNIQEGSEYESEFVGTNFDSVLKQARSKVCEKVVQNFHQFVADEDIEKSGDFRSQLNVLCQKVLVESMDKAFTETIRLKIKVNDNIACTYNEKDYILLHQGDEFQTYCFDELNDAKKKTYGLAYDAVKENLGPVFEALHRGPKSFGNSKTVASFIHYLEVVGSNGKIGGVDLCHCFGQFILQEQCDESGILYLPIDFKQLCQKAGEQLKNITVEEVASEVNEGNMTVYREMSVIFKSGASNNKRQKIVPFPDNVCSIPKRSPGDYPRPYVPKIEDVRKHIPFEICSDEDWTIVTINSAQQMIDIGNSKFIESKVLGIDFEADDDHLALMSVTNFGPDHRIFILDLISNEVRENFPSVFGKMLEDSKILKIGHSLRSLDRPKLLHELDCMMVGMYDTQLLYKQTIGLEKVLSMCEVPRPANHNTNTKKAYQLWNWCKRPIDKDALNYAAMDVANLAAIMTFQFNKYPTTVISNVLMQSNKALNPSK